MTNDNNSNEYDIKYYQGVDPYLTEIRKVAKKVPNMTLKEYFKTYAPEGRSNDCCFQCKYSAGFCSWSCSGVLPEGTIAYIELDHHNNERTKILYCPMFEEGSSTEGHELNPDGCFSLLLEIAAETGEQYREALRTIIRLREVINPSAENNRVDITQYKQALALIACTEEVLDKAVCSRMKAMVGFEENHEFDDKVRRLKDI